MTAKIRISPDARLDLIAEAAGQSDINSRIYRDGFLEVEGVSQESLEAAVNNPVVAQKKSEGDEKRKKDREIVNKWPTLADLVNDILDRGVDAVREDRDSIKASKIADK